MIKYAQLIASELSLRLGGVQAALGLLDQGNTIPFIARYRKEQTGELDEVQIRDIRDRAEYLSELDERKQAILVSIEEQGKLTPQLNSKLESAATKAELEDLYRPYKPRRRTRALIAIERGLERLADLLHDGRTSDADLRERARAHVGADREIPDVEAALAGARDIVAERVAEDVETRSFIRDLTRRKGLFSSKAARGKANEASKFQDYYDFSEAFRTIPSHRILAIRRGETEEFLVASIVAPEEEILGRLEARYVAPSRSREQMAMVIADAYRRLIGPSVEVELRMELKIRADDEAIRIFGQNLEGLLLAPPAGGKITLGVDPGFRTGCKLAVISRTGSLLQTGVIYLHQEDRAAEEIRRMVQVHGVELIAIGNGTASRETDKLARVAVADLDQRPVVTMVSEAGASVYSASDVAREELPELDLTLRSAVSIARRIQDPLSELVKVDPKAIGVGQYQHDVPQPKLKRSLDETVESCVNRVGVELNTASPSLLSYVSGIGATVAQKVVRHRDSKGSFRSRRELLAVSGLGARTFEQAAGFLRIPDGEHPLDASAVHPERYPLVERMAGDIGVELRQLVGNESAISRIDPSRYVGPEVGLPTLRDILDELRKPGRDPRKAFEAPQFRDDVNQISDLREGMTLHGTVTNVVAFGAFVDIGVHQDGLVHVSQLADGFVKDPSAIVSVGDLVRVRVVNVDLPRKRIGLSMRSETGSPSSGAKVSSAGSPRRPDLPQRSTSIPQEEPAPPSAPSEGMASNGMRIRRK